MYERDRLDDNCGKDLLLSRKRKGSHARHGGVNGYGIIGVIFATHGTKLLLMAKGSDIKQPTAKMHRTPHTHRNCGTHSPSERVSQGKSYSDPCRP